MNIFDKIFNEIFDFIEYNTILDDVKSFFSKPDPTPVSNHFTEGVEKCDSCNGVGYWYSCYNHNTTCGIQDECKSGPEMIISESWHGCEKCGGSGKKEKTTYDNNTEEWKDDDFTKGSGLKQKF